MPDTKQTVLEQAVADQWKVLPSGLTVLVRPMPGYSSTHVIFATKFGSIDRDFRLDGKEVHLPAGVAHFLEHKMFEDQDGDAFAKYAKTGANANAFTSFDRTCYLFTATQQLDESLDVLLGMVTHPYFTEQTIAKEQGIIGQEIKMYDDSPDWRLLNALFRCLYADHPLRDDIAGTVESIAELTPQMLYSCTRGFYAPSNMVLSVAGKITLAQAVDACKRNGLYRARAPHEVEWDIPAQTGPLHHKEAFFTMPVTKPCFGVAYREEPLAEGDLKRELLLDMLGDLVVGGLTKLYRRLYDEALVNPEFSGDFIAVRGACTVAFTGESDTPRQVVDLLQEEIERMRREGVDPEFFMLVKNQMYGELLGDVEAVDDAAEEAAAACLKGRTLADEIAALAALTVEDANALLQTALREENRAYVQIDPAEK
ncbi:MAG: insulinase family protein [Subdoligranulum sp.]|nr:insulinase family protein [Subdoligranulum sp.]